jgi:alkanesulfonate monooxygenase SsuD/methylene tetrahydromethanopterin reductase-like flavin-dependent oxidoreductase (luciferase family)
MKFALAINMMRRSPDDDMKEVARHTLEMVQMADRGGFEIAWAAEHHAIEMTVAPAPFSLLTWWAAHTDNIRLGTAVVQAPYWHPVKLAGEAAQFDLLSGGRLEFGIGRGAYQREFNRLAGGMKQQLGVAYMQEMVPLLKQLWAGDCEHDGTYWSFPATTSCPKPLQKPHPPMWVAARDPGTFDWALANGCNIMTWALSRPFSEVETYLGRFEDALAKAPGVKRPRFMTMRTTGVYENEKDLESCANAVRHTSAQFENLFKELGAVTNGFPEEIDLAKLDNHGDYDTETLCQNLIFGTPDQVIEKLKAYEALGIDIFLYNASYGLPMAEQRKSLRLFIDEVMPAFEGSSARKAEAAE